MDWGHDERDYAAGHSPRAPRLADREWDGMASDIRVVADLARERHGVRPVIHPHAGGCIEFADEIERIAANMPPETAAFYAGMDPAALLERYAGRLDYIHSKDIDPALLRRIGYEGFITVEQERDPLNAGGSLADVEASRDYLKSVGF